MGNTVCIHCGTPLSYYNYSDLHASRKSCRREDEFHYHYFVSSFEYRLHRFIRWIIGCFYGKSNSVPSVAIGGAVSRANPR